MALASCDRTPTHPAGAPTNAALALARANELSNRHHVAEALASIESYRLQHPVTAIDDAEAALRRRQAELLINLSRPREALTLLDDLAPRFRGNWSFLKAHAQACLDSGEPAKALTVIDLAPKTGQESILIEQGIAMAAVGRTQEGAACLAAALVLDPWRDEGYLGLGRALARSGATAQASILLERHRAGEAFRLADQQAVLLEFAGDEARALHRRALAEKERGRLFEVLQLENRAIQLKPSQGEPYLELGRLSIFLGRPQDAIKALEQLPQTAQVKEILELAAAAARDPGSATPGSLESLRLEIARRQAKKPLSHSVPELLELTTALEEAGKTDDARKLSLIAVRLAPSRSEPRQAVLRVFSAPGEVFVRLWAIQPIGDASAQARFDAELSTLGIDAVVARSFLARK